MEKMNGYQLARLADVTSPDGPESPGAIWLQRVANAIEDHIRYTLEQDADATAEEMRDGVSDVLDGIAPPIYTYEKWQVFVDLGAWEEDLSDWGQGNDLDALSDTALWQIADRLAYRIIDAWESEQDDSEDD